MAIAMNSLKDILREQNMNFFDNGRSIMIPYGIDRQQINIILRLHENGELLSFTIYDFLYTDRSTDKARAFEKILKLNRKLKIGNLGLSSDSNSIAFEVALPIEDNDVSSNQIRRILRAMTGTSRRDRINLQRYIDTGADAETEIEETVRKLLENVTETDPSDEVIFDDTFREIFGEDTEMEDGDA